MSQQEHLALVSSWYLSHMGSFVLNIVFCFPFYKTAYENNCIPLLELFIILSRHVNEHPAECIVCYEVCNW